MIYFIFYIIDFEAIFSKHDKDNKSFGN